MPTNILEQNPNIPHGVLGIIGMPGCEELVEKIDKYLVTWRKKSENELKHTIAFNGYQRESYLVHVSLPRFSTGEAKAVIGQSVRGYDLYIVCDCFNYGCTYKMYEKDVPMSPDEHFADLKRIIAAAGGKASRITVVMPMLYEGRQHKRTSRESLDCALALQELVNMGVDNIITFDAHDPRVQNSIPLSGFEDVKTTYQMLKALIRDVDDIQIDKDHLSIISPDEGGMARCIFYSTVLGLDLGMFYKRRDYTKIINGRNAIIAHEYLGGDLEGKDVIIVDDMISSGDSMLEVAKKLKDLNANRIFIFSTFGLFCNGLELFDKAYDEGIISKVFTTNSIYRTEALKEREWYSQVDVSKYIAYIVDMLNHDISIGPILDSRDRIHRLMDKHGFKIPELPKKKR